MSLDAKQVSVELKIGDVEVPVSAVDLYHKIDELPYAQIRMQLDNRDARQTGVAKIGNVKLDLEQFGKLHKVMQEKIFNDFALTPDVAILVKDAEGNELKFVGFLGDPSFRLIEGDLILTVTAVHHMAVLQAVNAQIYAEQPNYELPFLAGAFSEAGPITADITPGFFLDIQKLGRIVEDLAKLKDAPLRSDSIAQRIRVILEALHKRYTGHLNLETGQLDTFPVFNLNAKALKYATDFLKRSEPFTMIEGIKDENFQSDTLHFSIYQALVNSPNFLMALSVFRSMFLFQMNATWDGKAWLEHLFTVHPTEGRRIQSPVIDVAYSVARMFELPIVQVLVQSGGSGFWILQGEQGVNTGDAPLSPEPTPFGDAARATIDRGETSLKSIAKFPLTVKSTAAGNYYLIQAPAWVGPDRFLREDMENPGRKGRSKFDVVPEVYELMRKKLKDKDGARKKVLDYLAEFTFKDLVLQGTAATEVIPLNVAVAAGRTYDVVSMEEDEMYSGYLRGITHSIVISKEAASATTTLMFTHIRAANATLNPIDKDNFDLPIIGDIDSVAKNIA